MQTELIDIMVIIPRTLINEYVVVLLNVTECSEFSVKMSLMMYRMCRSVNVA